MTKRPILSKLLPIISLIASGSPLAAVEYKSEDYRLELGETFASDEMVHVDISELPESKPLHPARLVSSSPFLEKLFLVALADIESNMLVHKDEIYFCAGGAGKGWGGTIFTRDMSLSGLLGLNDFFPEVMYSNLRLSRIQRKELGFKTRADSIIKNPNVQNIVLDDGEFEDLFRNKYRAQPMLYRTDDVVWLWCAGDLLAKHFDNEEDWKWLYENGEYFFKEIYAPFYDPEDGLYRGQSVFVDIAWNGYPKGLDLRNNIDSKNLCIEIKATATNCAYYKAMRVMAQAAGKLGMADEQKTWT